MLLWYHLTISLCIFLAFIHTALRDDKDTGLRYPFMFPCQFCLNISEKYRYLSFINVFLSSPNFPRLASPHHFPWNTSRWHGFYLVNCLNREDVRFSHYLKYFFIELSYLFFNNQFFAFLNLHTNCLKLNNEFL